MLKIGMWTKIETDIESLEEAKIRKLSINRSEFENFEKPKENFFQRLFPRNKEEKPGKDLYLYTVLSQFMILFFLFVFFNKMNGNKQSISESIQYNQFQGGMVIAIVIVIMIIILERYTYLKYVSRAIQDAAKNIKISKDDNFNKTLTAKMHKTQQIEVEYPLSSFQTVSQRKNLLEESKNEFHRSQAITSIKEAEENEDESNIGKEKGRSILLIIKLIIHAALILIVHIVIF